MKTCTKCLHTKPRGEFNTRRASPDGLQYLCKSCKLVATKSWRRRSRIHLRAYDRGRRRTKAGYLRVQHSNMRGRAAGRIPHVSQHSWLNCRVLPVDAYVSWALTDHDFLEQFAAWEKAGYPRRLAPSIDRIDSNGHYEHPNIRFLPQWLNSSKRLNV